MVSYDKCILHFIYVEINPSWTKDMSPEPISLVKWTCNIMADHSSDSTSPVSKPSWLAVIHLTQPFIRLDLPKSVNLVRWPYHVSTNHPSELGLYIRRPFIKFDLLSTNDSLLVSIFLDVLIVCPMLGRLPLSNRPLIRETSTSSDQPNLAKHRSLITSIQFSLNKD